jgi:signal transduction histidine kinase
VVFDVRDSLGLSQSSQVMWICAVDRSLTVDADPEQLFRILLNLARNSLQALEGGFAGNSPHIRVAGRREGAVTVIEVSDTGPGVPAKAREHLFEAFHGSARSGGTGLGLAIAAELVRAHGGDIRLVEGTIGATFRIAIPDQPVELSARRDRARA